MFHPWKACSVWRSRTCHRDTEMLKVSNKNPWLWITQVWIKDLRFSCAEGLLQGWWLSTVTISRTWKASCKAGLACCKTTLQKPALSPSFIFSFSQYGLKILKAVSMANPVDKDSQHWVVFLLAFGPPNRWGLWTDWQCCWWLRIKTSNISVSSLLDCLLLCTHML